MQRQRRKIIKTIAMRLHTNDLTLAVSLHDARHILNTKNASVFQNGPRIHLVSLQDFGVLFFLSIFRGVIQSIIMIEKSN